MVYCSTKDLYWVGVYYGYVAEDGNADGRYWKVWTLEQQHRDEVCKTEDMNNLRQEALREAKAWRYE